MSELSTDLEYIMRDDSIFTLFDEDSVDQYALETQFDEERLENQQSFEAINGKTYLNLPPLEEEDSIDDTFEFSLVSNHHDDTVQEFGFPLYRYVFSRATFLHSQGHSVTMS